MREGKGDGRRLELERLWLLPGVVGVSEVAVGGSLGVDWSLEIELLDYIANQPRFSKRPMSLD